ncbi:acyltransferase family protein [Sphingobacterium multivorum]|uniref:acyltransferase family protein n=1 Tax=Sphingobacterium multivorum TaxID=28454 RepID=UPI003DA32259
MKRDHYYDSVKFVLICLVIIGHVFEINRGFNKVSTTLYNFIYFFHMPLFIFISGFFSKNIDLKKLVRGNFRLLETYIIFQIIFYVIIFLNKSSVPSTSDILNVFVQPYYALWYLLSLVFWRVLIFLFKPVNKGILITLSILISLAVGFVQGVGYSLSLSKTIVYFPFFILGYFCTSSVIEKIKMLPKTLCASILSLSLILCFFLTNEDLYKLITGGRSYYETGYDTWLSLGVRALFYPISIVLSICFLAIIKSSRKTSQFGEKTLVFYVYHLFLLLIVSKLLKVIETNFITEIVASLSIIVCLAIISKFDFFTKILNPVSSFLIKDK